LENFHCIGKEDRISIQHHSHLQCKGEAQSRVKSSDTFAAEAADLHDFASAEPGRACCGSHISIIARIFIDSDVILTFVFDSVINLL